MFVSSWPFQASFIYTCLYVQNTLRFGATYKSVFAHTLRHASDYHTSNMSWRLTYFYPTVWYWGKHLAMCRHLSTARSWSRHSKQQNICFECLLSDLCSDSLEHSCFDEGELIQGLFGSHTGHRRLSSGIICDVLSFQRSTPFKKKLHAILQGWDRLTSKPHAIPAHSSLLSRLYDLNLNYFHPSEITSARSLVSARSCNNVISWI